MKTKMTVLTIAALLVATVVFAEDSKPQVTQVEMNAHVGTLQGALRHRLVVPQLLHVERLATALKQVKGVGKVEMNKPREGWVRVTAAKDAALDVDTLRRITEREGFFVACTRVRMNGKLGEKEGWRETSAALH